jgi:hypothetical protein
MKRHRPELGSCVTGNEKAIRMMMMMMMKMIISNENVIIFRVMSDGIVTLKLKAVRSIETLGNNYRTPHGTETQSTCFFSTKTGLQLIKSFSSVILSV